MASDRATLGTAEGHRTSDPLAIFTDFGVTVERTREGGGLAVESVEVWRLPAPAGLELTCMAMGPRALRSLRESADARGRVPLDMNGEKHWVDLRILERGFASNVHSGDDEFDDLVSIRSGTPEATARFLALPAVRRIVSAVVETGGRVAIQEQSVKIVILEQDEGATALSDPDRGLLLRHLLSLGE